MQSDTSNHAVSWSILASPPPCEPFKKIYMFFFDYWTVFSTLIQFIHELAPRSLWLINYFIDRDGTHFRYILNYLRTGQLIVPEDKIIRRELFTEAKFYQVQGMIEELKPCSFEDSGILSVEQRQTLTSWLKDTMAGACYYTLIYRASRDGWAASAFHSFCDRKGPTVVIVKSGYNIFGGYAAQHWECKLWIR